jgi:hypothetical protein
LLISFSCNEVLEFTCSALSRCQWANTRTLFAFVKTSDECVKPGGGLKLATATIIKAPCAYGFEDCSKYAQWPFTNTSSPLASLNIANAANPILPSIIISIPLKLSWNCSSLTLDLTGSYGNGGRSWRNMSILVSSDIHGLDLSKLQGFLDIQYKMNPPSSIPAHYFPLPNVRYIFQVKLCNFLGACSYATESVMVISEVIPTIKIISSQSSPMKITRSQSLSLLSAANIDSMCLALSVGKNSISYNWTTFEVVTQTEKQFQRFIISISKDPSRFVLPSYSLLSNHTYEIILTVSSAFGYFQSSSTSLQVVVKQGSLLAKIKGGTNERNIRNGESLSLDASNSYDEDKGDTVRGRDAGLRFEWVCMQTKPIVNRTSCAILFELHYPLFSSIITMKASTNSENSKAQWTLLISDESGSRSTSSSIIVSILPLLSPTISLQSNALLGEEGGTMNAAQGLQIAGNINIPAGLKSNATWSVLGFSHLSLASLSLTPLSQQFPVSATSSQSFTISLALPGNALVVGSSYTFGLRCQLSYPGKSAISTITINVNSPPTPGSFTIQPMSGRELIDSFTFLCNQWIDANLPLSYQFSYLSLSGTKIVVRSSSIISFTSSKLPGGSSRNGSVLCTADIFDSLTANSTASLPIYIVKAGDVKTIDASTFIHTTLADAATVDDLMKGTAIASYLLNSANCSLSPNCSSLNRLPCYSTSHTCGSCLSSSLIGQKGDSNDKCYDPLLSSSISVDHQLRKVCAGNCSSHGHCIAYSALTNSLLTSFSSLSPIPCYDGDLSCYMKCECDIGYQKSPNCEISDHQMEERSKLREIVVSRVIDYINLQDASETTIYAWMNSLNEVSKVSHELSNSSISSIMKVSLEAITTVRDRGIDVHVALSNLLTTAGTIADAIVFQSNVFSTSTSFDSSSSSSSPQLELSLLSMLRNYSILIADSMVPDQLPSRSANGNFRLHSALLSTINSPHSEMEECDTNASIVLPATALETTLGYRPSLFTVPLCSLYPSSSVLSISLISLSSSAYHNPEFTSDPVSLQLSSLPCVNPEDENCKAKVILNSDNNDGRFIIKEYNFTVNCNDGDFENHTVRCPSSMPSGFKNHTVSCQGKAKTITITCPSVFTVPTCNGLFGEATADIGCTVTAVSERNITCSCPLVASQARRQLAHLLKDNSSFFTPTVEISYVAMLEAIEGNFVATVISAAALNGDTAAKSWQVLVILGSFLCALVVALLLSDYADRKVKTSVDIESKMMRLAKSVQPVGPQNSRKHRVSIRRAITAKETKISTETMISLAEEALPSILSSQSLRKRIWNEIKRHHRWIGVIYYFSNKFPRILRVVSLATNIIVMLFIQSLTYNLTQGDDGSCEAFHSEESCLSPRSAYGTDGSKCYWSAAEATSVGNCTYIQPESSMYVVLFIAIFSALVSTPVALLADWIIHRILAAPTLKVKDLISPDAIDSRKLSAVFPLNSNSSFSSWNSHRSSIFVNVVTESELKEAEERAIKEFILLRADLSRYLHTIATDQSQELKGNHLSFSSLFSIICVFSCCL